MNVVYCCFGYIDISTIHGDRPIRLRETATATVTTPLDLLLYW